MSLKVCARCGELKPMEQFYHRPRPSSYCRPCTRAYVLAWRQRFPGRREAHAAVATALKNGELQRQTTCEHCGIVERMLAHHEDYARPLDVTWLCDHCHAMRHVALRKAARAAQEAVRPT